MEQMNVSLQSWVSGDQNLADCPSFRPMSQSEMDNFLANGIGTSGNLTLGKILTQKRIALHFSVEIWKQLLHHRDKWISPPMQRVMEYCAGCLDG